MIFRRFLVVLCCFVFLTSCSINDNKPTLTDSSGELSLPKETDNSNSFEQISSGVKAVTTEDEVRAMYKNQEVYIDNIKPYNGDFLVQYSGTKGYGPWLFDWVYGKSGARYKLMFCDENIRELEIEGPGRIRVLTNGENCNVPFRSFPSIRIASVAVTLDENGQPLPYEEAYTDDFRIEYWADIHEPSSLVGVVSRREVVINALVGVSGVEFAFGPPADIDGIGSFFAASCTIPSTEISFDKESRIMTVLFYDTLLSSGNIPVFTDAAEKKSYWQMLQNLGLSMPTQFPAGTLYGKNPLISYATIEEKGNDTVVKLILTEKATEYTVNSGSTGPDDIGPYLCIILRERSNW